MLRIAAHPWRVQARGAEAVARVCVRRLVHPVPERTYLVTLKSGNVFRVGIFLGFVRLTTRTPHGAYLWSTKQNRIDPHWGEIEQPAWPP